MSFDADIMRFVLKLDARDAALLPAVAMAVHTSIVEGSPVTGAPGQVVADEHGGNLRGSWQLTFPAPDTAQSSTNVAYAQSNEDGIARPGGGPYVQRSAIGGRWNVALTRAGFQKLVDHVARELKDGSGGGGA
jgi:hypothetical protein